MIIVTGGAGFIGSAFISYLNSKDIKDIIVVDELESSSKWKNLNNKSFLDYYHKDDFIKLVQSEEIYENFDISKIKAIVHLGACSATTETDVDYLMDNNYKYSCELAKFSIRNNIRFIYASSAATYGNGEYGYNDDENSIEELKPLNPYGFSKQIFDLWLKNNNFLDNVVGLKFFNVYGPNEYHKENMISVVNSAYYQLQETGKIKLFKSYHPDYEHGAFKRDFVYVKDCCNLMFELINNLNVNGVFNCGTGNAESWNELANAVIESSGGKGKIEYIEMPESLQKQYQYFTEASMDKLNSKLDISFSSLKDGVNDYVKNYLSNSSYY